MARAEELVQEFRSMVDSGVSQTVKLRKRHQIGVPLWGLINGDQVVAVGGFRLASVPRGAGRPVVFSLGDDSEHLWGVSPRQEYRLGRWSGRVALASTAELPNGLVRHWSFNSAFEQLPVSSKRTLTEVDDLQAGVDWLRSPHLATEALEHLGSLTDEERVAIKAEMAKYAQSRVEFQKDLDALDKARRATLSDPDFYTKVIC